MGGQARLQGQAIPTPVACTCMPDHEARLLGCATQDVDITLPPPTPTWGEGPACDGLCWVT